MRRLFVVVLTCGLAGCGGGATGDYSVAEVSGVIKMDGEPLADAKVVFQPDPGDDPAAFLGPTSEATTDAQGRYSLSIPTTGQAGAVVGPNMVMVTRGVEWDDDETDELPEDETLLEDEIPVRYNDETELSFTVPAGGTTSANFELKSEE